MASQPEPNVGQRIRDARERLGLSLRALAQQAGLSVNAISLIERGENSPTVSSLHLLATALNVSITDFFQDEEQQAVVVVRPSTRLRAETNGISMESLGIGLHRQQLEPFLLTVAPSAGNVDQPVNHAGEEFVFCLEGKIEYAVADNVYTLAAGDSLLFDASLDHCFHNRTDQPVQLMMVFFAGEGGHIARRLHLEASAISR